MIEAISLIILLIGISLGIQVHYTYFSISIFALVLFFYFQRRKKKKEARLIKERIASLWGKEHFKPRDFLYIDKLYNFYLEKDKPDFHIDNITWNDLNMDTVFSKLDHTKSLPGAQFLYYLLRNPLFDKNVLKRRNEIIASLMDNKDIAQKIQYPLTILGKKSGLKIFKYFNEEISADAEALLFLKPLSYMPYISIAIFLINKQIGFVLLFAMTMINSIVYQIHKKKIYTEMDTFKYLANLLKCAKEIVKIDTNNIDLWQEEIKDLLNLTKKTSRNLSKINFNDTSISDFEVFIHYYNMIFLREPIVFYKTIKSINKHREHFFRMYATIGKIDAYISIASYKSGIDYFTEPEFIEEGNKFYLGVKEIYHPLLDSPVPYSIELNNKGALVTGSNASGKSTFLRTIGINSIFAQTLSFVLAKDYKTNYFKLMTSIGITDSIVEGDSYFMAEAKSLLRVINELSPYEPVLCILDEIFRGTNTAERISAANESLDYMINRNCCVIAATHDLELTNLVSERYSNYHFKETIDNNDISFDYILRQGPCTSRNGIAILKYLGYPEEIHEKASIRAEEYLVSKQELC